MTNENKFEIRDSGEVNSINFCVSPDTEIMRLDEAGMVYKGERIEDAGAAYKAFMEVMTEMKKWGQQ
jgi:hypothetical protein